MSEDEKAPETDAPASADAVEDGEDDSAASDAAKDSSRSAGAAGDAESKEPRASKAAAPDEKAPSFYVEIFAVALAAILLEIAYTRVFSFKVFYYFTYLILGVGLLGIGAGGVLVAISNKLRTVAPARLIPPLCFGGGLSVYLGYLVVAPTQLNASKLTSDSAEMAALLGMCLVLVVPFLTVGVVISTILGSRPRDAGKLYGADLCGAALACVMVIPLLKLLGPPGAIALSGLLLAASGLRLAKGASRVVGAALCLALAVPVGLKAADPDPNSTALLPDPTVDQGKSYEEFRDGGLVKRSEWNPVFRVDISAHPLDPDNTFLLHHDGQPGSGLRRFDRTFDKFQYLKTDSRSMPYAILPKDPKVLVIGSAGGHELVASLFFGAGHVTGVELNPVTLSLLTQHFADLSGRLHEHPKVKLVNGDGRWFLKQTEERYDLIWFVAPDSYAAMNAATAGAFVLSESYLYTVEMLREAWRHLTPEGIICTQFGELAYDTKPNRTTRYLATARKAYADEGIFDFGNYTIIGGAAGFPPFAESVILLAKEPLVSERVQKFHAQAKLVDQGSVRWAPGRPPDDTPVNQVISVAEEHLNQWYRQYPYQVDPVHDDSPFFWHFTRYSDAIAASVELGGGLIDYEDTIGEKVTLTFLMVALFLAGLFLLLPFVTIRAVFKKLPHKGGTLLYFASLGLGFMFVEIALIQKLTLFLGYPTHSLSVTLFGILVFSGIGSLLSERLAANRNRALLGAVGVLVALVLVYQLALPSIIDAFVGSSFALRVVITTVMIAPLGLCLGSFMPIGLRTVAGIAGDHSREYVAWAWAINGFFSVIASILSTILGMVVGFRLLMLISLLVYAVGVAALLRTPTPDARAG